MAKVALLIGVSEYEAGLNSLYSTVNDIAALQRVLQHPDIGNFNEVKLLPNPDRQSMEEAIETFFSSLKKDDLAVLYFSGHGIKDEKGKLYLATRITRKSLQGELVKSTAVAASFVHDMMSNSRCKRQVMIIDSCFSGAFVEGMLARDDGYVDIKTQLGGEGRVILTSSTSTQYSFEKKGSELSIYTSYLVEGIETGLADEDQDGWISTHEIHEYVRQKVQEVEPAMKPEIYAVREGFKIRIAKTSEEARKEPYQDWGDAPDVPIFFGRDEELVKLENWIIEDRCCLIAILGIGGIGKTDLSIKLGKGGIGKTDLSLKLVKGVQDNFDYVIWRSLLNAPPITEVLKEFIKFLSNQQDVDLPETISEQISRLLHYLRQHRCLLVLDNVEAILQGGELSGEYREGYEGYGELFKKIGEVAHKSCLLLTSREKPREIARLEGRKRPVRSIALQGLGESDGRKIFATLGTFFGSDTDWKELIDFYNGNPLALELVAKHISDVFNGSISNFLQQGKPVFSELRELLDWHFERLSNLEKEVMYWLAINREAVSVSDLLDDIVLLEAKEKVTETLQSLQRRIPLERSSNGFTLQPVLIEYVTEKIVKLVCEEINTSEIILFNNHALIKATVQDYVRESQVRLILKPIIERLIRFFKNQKNLEIKLEQLIKKLRLEGYINQGYAGGNILNLFCRLGVNLTNYDFSGLAVWQACLQDISLHNTNFTRANLSKSIFIEPFGCILSVAFSPDGQLFATGDAVNEVRLWRTSDCQQLLIFRGHNNWVRAVTFSPDGKTLASAGDDSTVNLWDVRTGQGLITWKEHNGQIKALGFSPDGKTLASGNVDGSVTLWDANSGQCLKILQGHSAQLRAVIFTSDCQTLVTSSADCTVRIWDSETGQCLKVLNDHTDWVWAAAISPNDQTIVSGSGDKTLKLWDFQTGQCLMTLLGHSGEIRSVAFHPNGEVFASGSDDKTIKLWNIQTGQCLRTLQGHTSFLWSVAFSPDGSTLASVSDDKTLKLWNVKSGQCFKTLQGYISWAFSVAQSPDGQTLATANDDKTVKLWDINTGQCLKTLQGHTSWVWSVAFSPDGRILASSGGDYTAKFWDINTGQCLKTLQGHTSWVWSVAFSPDGQTLATVSDDKLVKLWNVNTGECSKTLYGHLDSIYAVAFSPNGLFFATGGSDGMLKLWDTQTGDSLKTFHSSAIVALAVSPDGQTLATVCVDKTLNLWNTHTGECTHSQTLDEPNNILADIAFSSDGQTIATGGAGKVVKLWDIQTGRCLKSLVGHTYPIRSVAFSPDTQTLIAGGGGEMIKVWSLQTGECLKTIKPPRPYEGMNITDITGLTDAQKDTLKALGAIELNHP